MSTTYTYQLSSIPTPPFSPNPVMLSQPDGSLQSTLNLLNSLVDFYQQERAWVQHTRTALEDAFYQVKQSDKPHIPPSPPSESDSTSNTECSEKLYINESPSPASSDKQQVSQWSKRKKGFKLRLDSPGRPHRNCTTSRQPLRRIASYRDFSQRKQILDMFDQMMEARMETCQRVNRLVRNANRADLHYR